MENTPEAAVLTLVKSCASVSCLIHMEPLELIASESVEVLENRLCFYLSAVTITVIGEVLMECHWRIPLEKSLFHKHYTGHLSGPTVISITVVKHFAVRPLSLDLVGLNFISPHPAQFWQKPLFQKKKKKKIMCVHRGQKSPVRCRSKGKKISSLPSLLKNSY